MQFINRLKIRNKVKMLGQGPITLFIFCLLSSIGYAETTNNQQPMQLFAHKADLNQQTHTGEYSGGVKLHQGDNHLTAERAITKTTADNQLSEARAYGSSKKQAHFWTKIDPNKPTVHAYADEMRYFPLHHTIELLGHARVLQDRNAFLAPYIHYDIEKQRVTSNANGHDKIHIRFYPEKKT